MRYQKPATHYERLKAEKAKWTDENFFKINEKKFNLSKELSNQFNSLLSNARFLPYSDRHLFQSAVKNAYLECKNELIGFEMRQKTKSKNVKGATYVV